MRQWSALHYAAYNGFKRVCNLLLKWEADNDRLRDMKNSQEKKPIHICKNPETKEGFKRKFDEYDLLHRHMESLQRWLTRFSSYNYQRRLGRE